MPELPEVETIKRSLQKAIIGKKITGVQVLLTKQFQGKKEDVLGREILGVERRGKVLIIALGGVSNKKTGSQKAQKFGAFNDQASVPSVIRGASDKKLILPEGTEKVLLIHFKLTGQLIYIEHRTWNMEHGKTITLGYPIPFAGSQLPAKTTHVIFEIDGPPSPKASARQGGRLFFNDLRQFGWIKIIANSKLQIANSELGKLGPEPFSDEFTTDYLKQIFAKTSKPIKLVLMDQEKIAGIGNIYANEALWEAGISPVKPAKKLSNLERRDHRSLLPQSGIKKLREAIIKVLKDGLKYGGSSAADEAYIKPTGEPGKYQEHFRVYQREGQKCLRCGGIIKRIELGGRGTFYCPKCQK